MFLALLRAPVYTWNCGSDVWFHGPGHYSPPDVTQRGQEGGERLLGNQVCWFLAGDFQELAAQASWEAWGEEETVRTQAPVQPLVLRSLVPHRKWLVLVQ